MAVIEGLIRIEDNGAISFGNYLLDKKTKLDNVEYNGDIYKVKTYNEITKLERNGMFVYESVPGTTAHNFKIEEGVVTVSVEGDKDAQITLELEPSTEYEVYVNDAAIGSMKTNISGKLILSVELGSAVADIKIVKM